MLPEAVDMVYVITGRVQLPGHCPGIVERTDAVIDALASPGGAIAQKPVAMVSKSGCEQLDHILAVLHRRQQIACAGGDASKLGSKALNGMKYSHKQLSDCLHSGVLTLDEFP